MGTDLTLAPIRYPRLEWWLAHDRISLNRDYQLFEQIEDIGRDTGATQVCEPKPVPGDVRVDWYGNEGVRRITVDPYGSPLRWVYARELARVDLADVSVWNRAVFAFVRGLPPETQVLLYWH